MIISIDGVEI